MIAAIYARKSTEQNGVGDEEKSVTRQIEAQQRRVGYDVLCTQHQIGDMPRPTAMKSLKLFAETVIPAADLMAFTMLW